MISKKMAGNLKLQMLKNAVLRMSEGADKVVVACILLLVGVVLGLLFYGLATGLVQDIFQMIRTEISNLLGMN